MKADRIFLVGLLLAFTGDYAAAQSAAAPSPDVPAMETGGQTPMPLAWIDRDTGHRVIRLSRREGSNQSFYFHNNPFVKTRDGAGDVMVFYGDTPEGRQLFTVDLKTLEIDQLTDEPGRSFGEIVGRKRREVFYQRRDSVFATHVDTKQTRLVYVFPADFDGQVTTLNADETLLAGVHSSPEKRAILEQYPNKGEYFTRIFEARLPHTLFTVNVDTGELKQVYQEHAWLNHVQFSPDGRWVIFRANFEGESQVYAVAVDRE